MHYIIGTTITAPQSKSSGKIKPGMTSSQIRALSSGTTKYKEQRDQLVPGGTYTLTRIYKEDEKYVYKYVSGRSTAELIFESITSAENFIAELKGESIPDYSDVYKTMSD